METVFKIKQNITMIRYITAVMMIFACLLGKVQAQEKIAVTGKVVDASSVKKETVPGVTILLVATNQVIGQTDNDGNFRVTVAPNAELKFSYVGMAPVTVKVNSRRNFTVSLEPLNSNTLKTVEVVSAGYVTKTRTLSTGSIVKISGADIQGQPAGDAISLLQGKVAGLNIQNSTGAPGFRGSVQVRGLSNINVSGSGNNAYLTPTSPLYVIDGVPVDDNATFSYGFQQAGPGTSPASQIPAEDIEEIQLLKDAAATALYGSRGAYGVILITTKRGNSKVPVVRYQGSAFLSTVPQLRSVIGGIEERNVRLKQIMQYDSTYYHALGTINAVDFLSDSLNAYYNNSTNWQSYFYRPTYNQNHNLSISGGDVAFNYKVALGLYDEDGVQRNTGYSRYILNTTMTYNPSRKFKILGQLNNSVQQQQTGSGNGIFNTGVASGGSASSLLPPPSLYSAVNQVQGATESDNDNKTLNTFAVVQLDYEILKNFKASTVVNYTNITGTRDNFVPAAINGGFANFYSYNDRSTKLYNRSSLSYVFTINDKANEPAHNFSVFAFTEINSSNFKADAILNDRTVNGYIRGPLTHNPAYNQTLGGTLDNFSDFRSVGFAGQFSYNYKQKYVLDVNYRVDGTSTNGPLAGYVKNPSVSVKWNFDKENFLQGNHWLDYGDIRLSYGSNITPNGSIYDVYGRYFGGGAYNNIQSVVIDLNRLPNLSLQPTRNTTLNAGLDFSIFKNKLNVSFDTYYKQVDNIFRDKGIANINSFANVTTVETSNVNYGWEFQVNSRPLNPNSPFKLNVYANLAINREVLAALPDGARQLIALDPDFNQDIYYRLGINSLSNFLYNTKGVYKTTDDVPIDPMTGKRYRTGGTNVQNYFRAGDPIYTDLNGDYILDQNDRVVAGNSQPQITGGIGAMLNYKNWSIEVNGSFTLIRDVLNNALAAQFRNFNNPTRLGNLVPLSAYSYWNGVGTSGVYPNPFDYTRAGIVDPFRYGQTLFQEDGTYFKLNSVKLYYTLNKSFSSKFGINRANVYVTAQNLGFITNYSGPNPEAVTALGRDSSGGYPLSKQFVLGLNLEF